MQTPLARNERMHRHQLRASTGITAAGA